jgi:GLPGLI family protein
VGLPTFNICQIRKPSKEFNMKKALLFIAALVPFLAFGQTEGTVTYIETVQLNIELPEGHEDMMANMPKSQSFSKTLFFNEKEAVYKDTPESEDEGEVTMSHESEGMSFQIKMERPENTFYTNLDDGTTLNAREFFGRKFLVTGEAGKAAWKLTGEQKTLLGYTCQKAALQEEDRNIVAWFTPQIQVPAGPDSYGGLPGLILEINVNDGERTVLASNIELKKLEKGAIEKPTKGKKLTQEEFDKIEAEKRKEMEEEMGGSGHGVKMIIRN